MFEMIATIYILFFCFQKMPLFFLCLFQIFCEIVGHNNVFDGQIVSLFSGLFIKEMSFLFDHSQYIILCASFGQLADENGVVTGTVDHLIGVSFFFPHKVGQILDE